MGDIYSEDDFKNDDSNSSFNKKTQILDAFGINLSKMAENDELDPVIGRSDEIERIIQILGRRRKNNPVLVGEAGVGKCVTGDTEIEIRNKKTGKIEKITINDFLKLIQS